MSLIVNHSAKMMVVGNANIGKTTLVKTIASEWTVVDTTSVLVTRDVSVNVSTDGIGTFSFLFCFFPVLSHEPLL